MRIVVISSGEAHPIGHDVEAVALPEILQRLATEWGTKAPAVKR